MMELDEPDYASHHPMLKKISHATRGEEEEDKDELNLGDWTWKARDFEDSGSLQHEFASFLD